MRARAAPRCAQPASPAPPAARGAVIPRNKPIDCLFGAINDANAEVTMYSVAGSLNNAMDFSQYIQNVRRPHLRPRPVAAPTPRPRLRPPSSP